MNCFYSCFLIMRYQLLFCRISQVSHVYNVHHTYRLRNLVVLVQISYRITWASSWRHHNPAMADALEQLICSKVRGDTSFGVLYDHHYSKLATCLAFIEQLNTKSNTSQSREPMSAEWTYLRDDGAESGLNFSNIFLRTSMSASPPIIPQAKDFNESLGTFDLISGMPTSASKPISGRRWCVLRLFVWACLHFSSSLVRIRQRNPSRTVSILAEAPDLNWWVIYAQEV